MRRNSFDEFRKQRELELVKAIGMVEAMRHSLPLRVYAAHLTELYNELRQIRNTDVINIEHIRLMRAREALK